VETQLYTAAALRRFCAERGVEGAFVEGGGVSVVEASTEEGDQGGWKHGNNNNNNNDDDDDDELVPGVAAVDPEQLLGARRGAFAAAYRDDHVCSFWPAKVRAWFSSARGETRNSAKEKASAAANFSEAAAAATTTKTLTRYGKHYNERECSSRAKSQREEKRISKNKSRK